MNRSALIFSHEHKDILNLVSLTFEGQKIQLSKFSYINFLPTERFSKGDCGDILSSAAHIGAFHADKISPSFFVEGLDFSVSPFLSDVGFFDFDSGFNPISSTAASYL